MTDLNKVFAIDKLEPKNFQNYLKVFIPEINYALKNLLEEEENTAICTALSSPFNNYISSAGKRHRPLLCILACIAFNGDINKAIRPACAIEVFHNSALIHDDIVDRSQTRHGQACLHKKIGEELAINAGDYGYFLAEKMILDAQNLKKSEQLAVLQEFTEMAISTIKGQAMDISWGLGNTLSIKTKQYLEMAKRKTAYYSCAIPLVIGGICAGAKKEQLEVLREFGLCAGLAFQITDDLLCLISDEDKAKKDLSSDIKERKLTYVLLKALELADEENRDKLEKILNKGKIKACDIDKYKEIMQKSGAIEDSLCYAKKLSFQAKSILDNGLKNSCAKELLLSMADWCKDRLA
ncbi:MAG: polyprenyl synthetase family protein [Enterococcus sp.]|nr:polyprenyl synthetase family protein [Enterococcus sp.]